MAASNYNLPPRRCAKVPGDHRGSLCNHWVWHFPAWSGSWLFVKPNWRINSAVSIFELLELSPKWACITDTGWNQWRDRWMWPSTTLPCLCQPVPPHSSLDKLPKQMPSHSHKIFRKYHILWILRCSFLFYISVFLKWWKILQSVYAFNVVVFFLLWKAIIKSTMCLIIGGMITLWKDRTL